MRLASCWSLGLFLLFGSVNSEAVNIRALVSLVTYVFVSLRIVRSHWGALSSKIQEALGQLHEAKKVSTLWKLLRGGWEPE